MGDGEERDAAFVRLHAKYAPVALDVILALRGFYIKVGQFASARADIVPREYLQQFRVLQDKVPHEDLEQVRSIIESCLGQRADDLFAGIEEEPLGAASIGQVHRAQLHSGEVVVVKVQYPAVKRTFYADMSCIRTVVSLVEPSAAPILDELRTQFLTEFDYRGEARNLEDVAQNVLPRWAEAVTMPQPLLPFCGEHVLTMTFLPGEKLDTVLRREWERLGFVESDLRTRVTASSLGPRQMAWGLRMLRWKAALLDIGERCAVVWHRCLVHVGLAASPPCVATQPRIPDRQVLLRTLLAVHAQQVLTDGVFNADLHPGNFLLLPDGRLGLIDYGQVKRIDYGVRRKLAHLIVAVSRHDSEATVSALVELGVRSKNMDERFLNANAQLLFGRIDADLTGGRSLADFLQDFRTWDTLTHMPGDLYLPSRAAVMLRGLALLLHCEISVAEEWRSAAEQVLLDQQSCTV